MYDNSSTRSRPAASKRSGPSARSLRADRQARVETDEVLGTVLLLRDVLARALFVRHQGDPDLLGGLLDVSAEAADRIAVTVGVSFVEERERVIREQQAAIRERAGCCTGCRPPGRRVARARCPGVARGDPAAGRRACARAGRRRALPGGDRVAGGTTIAAHADADPGTEAVSVSPADVAALYAAVAPGRRSLRMSSAELAAEPARRALEGGGDGVRSMRSWVVASLRAAGGEDVGLIQAFDSERASSRTSTEVRARPDGGGRGRASAAVRPRPPA